jgi:hypothetical protein
MRSQCMGVVRFSVRGSFESCSYIVTEFITLICYRRTSYLTMQCDTIITGKQTARVVGTLLLINEVCVYWLFRSTY